MRASFFLPCVLALAGACVTNPAPEQAAPALISETREIEMGRDIDRYLASTRRFYRDSSWDHYLQVLGLRLAAKSERPGLPWTFRVVDDASVNAFAFPGGYVYVTRGLLVYLNSEAQLAAVLGHEVGHISAHHAGGESVRREMERRGLVVGTAGGSVTSVYGDVAGMQKLLLANSRAAEQEADDLGLHYMAYAGYDPTEMLAAMRTIEHIAGDSQAPGWQSTHPTWEDRIESITLGRAQLRGSGTVVERNAYLAHVNGLTFGPDRREGYFVGNRFVVPARGYQITFPSGWMLAKDGADAGARSPAMDAYLELTKADEPSADSAARLFFARHARPRGTPTHQQLNGLTIVSAEFSALPLWVKIRGSIVFVESAGTVYRMIGYTKNNRWSVYQAAMDSALRLEPVRERDLRLAQPLQVATLTLERPTSLGALVKARRGVPVEAAELAALNQVPIDSVLPAGEVVKWIVDPVRQ